VGEKQQQVHNMDEQLKWKLNKQMLLNDSTCSNNDDVNQA